MADERERVAGTHLRRTARLSGTAAAIAIRTTGARVAAGRSPEARREAVIRQQLRAAHALVKLLGGMRGAAMKVGQLFSTLDLGLVPVEIRDEVLEILGTLQDDAEPVPFASIRKVIEADLGRRLQSVFAQVDPEPLAAASIGQVHRAQLKDGREVVLKVQYPGIAEAVHADLRNLGLGLKLLSVIAPGVDSRAIAEEIRTRVIDELDYELEAANQRAMACAYREHPFIVVPAPVAELCRERVLVSDYVEGRHFAELLDAPAERRDRLGEILVRFYLNGPVRHRLLNGDAHPGNVLFLDDGRVAFLDYGFFKRLEQREVDNLIQSTRATYEQDAERLMRVVVSTGALRPDPALAEPFLEHYTAIFGWLLVDEPYTVNLSGTRRIMRHYHTLRGSERFAGLTLPAEHLLLMRAFMSMLGQLGQLRATNAWFPIAREWLFDGPPATSLGVLEAEYLAQHCR
jgi:predicted unusual protein kinase regulating ubiquinone biosynthesis (AarF/ABC1/UbiB family)